jgi:isoleucyl-tRNA synthetase
MKILMLFHGEQLKDIRVKHPLKSETATLPVVIYNNVTSTYGTGVNAVVPGHDVESLKIAAHYPEIAKEGCLDLDGLILKDVGYQIPHALIGLNVKEDATSAKIIQVL